MAELTICGYCPAASILLDGDGGGEKDVLDEDAGGGSEGVGDGVGSRLCGCICVDAM
jgi:hypothetical protein